MIPVKKVEELVLRHKSLESELSSGSIDKKLFATKSKEYSDINEIIIGLTIVATGTSLPELVTSIIAAFKGKTDLAIGNVIGSNLLNQLLILGSCSIFSGFKGLVIEQSLIKVDLPFMVLTTFACLPIFWSKGKITRIEGFILLNLYIFYILDKILFLNEFNFLSELRIGLFIYFALLIVFLIVQEKLKFSNS